MSTGSPLAFYFDKSQDISKSPKLASKISFVNEDGVQEKIFGLKNLTDIIMNYDLTAKGNFKALTNSLKEKELRVD